MKREYRPVLHEISNFQVTICFSLRPPEGLVATPLASSHYIIIRIYIYILGSGVLGLVRGSKPIGKTLMTWDLPKKPKKNTDDLGPGAVLRFFFLEQ